MDEIWPAVMAETELVYRQKSTLKANFATVGLQTKQCKTQNFWRFTSKCFCL